MSDDAATRPFYRFMGLDVKGGTTAGESRVELSTKPELANSRGDMHGGAIAALIDASVSVAVRSACTGGEGVATVSLTVNYAGPGRGTLVARGRALRVGRSIATAESTVTDADGNLVAHAIATLRVIAPRG
jgi:uncharacterized protein (TIGR00369 family)